MATFLLGYEGTPTTGTSVDRIYACRFATSTGGICDLVKVYSNANTNAKIGIYADNSGVPGSLLNANNIGTAVTSSQWNDIPISATTLSATTYYWIAMVSSDAGGFTANTATSGYSVRYYNSDYDDGLPSTLGTPDGSYTFGFCVAGYNGNILFCGPGDYSVSGADLTFGRGLSITCSEGTFSYSGADLDLTYDEAGEIEIGTGTFSYSGADLDFEVSRFIPFKVINYDDSTPSAIAATALEDRDLDFGTVSPLGYQTIKFKIGNKRSTKTTFTLTASGDSYSEGTYLYENIYFTTDKFSGKGVDATYNDVILAPTSVTITLKPNEISPVIWAAFACNPDYVGGNAEVKIKVVES